MSTHTDAPPELMPLDPCDCCGVPSSYLRYSMWHGRHRICAPCFYVWYDPDWADPTSPASVTAERLWRYGTGDNGEWPKEIPRAERGPRP